LVVSNCIVQNNCSKDEINTSLPTNAGCKFLSQRDMTLLPENIIRLFCDFVKNPKCDSL